MGLLSRLLRSRSRDLDISWLTEELAIAPAPRDDDWPAVKLAGLRAVLDLRAEAPDKASLVTGAHGLSYLRLPIEEYRAPTEDELSQAVDWIIERINSDEPVLVHCREGRGRGALVACAALVRLGLPLDDAYRLLLRARPKASLSREQEELLRRFGQSSDA